MSLLSPSHLSSPLLLKLNSSLLFSPPLVPSIPYFLPSFTNSRTLMSPLSPSHLRPPLLLKFNSSLIFSPPLIPSIPWPIFSLPSLSPSRISSLSPSHLLLTFLLFLIFPTPYFHLILPALPSASPIFSYLNIFSPPLVIFTSSHTLHPLFSPLSSSHSLLSLLYLHLA